MRKTVLYIASALLACGCFHENHELASLETGKGLIGTSLGWEMPEDASTGIHALTVSVGGAATPFSRQYRDAKDAAGELIPVALGRNDILATVNMTASDGFTINGMPAAKADAGVGDVIVSLTNPVSSPEQAWFGVTGTDVKEKEITIVEPTLQRLLSSISLNLNNVPAGTNVVLTLSNVAKSVNLTAKDANGRYGVPSAESVGDLEIANYTAATAGTLSLDGFTMLPTASAFARCILTIDVTSSNGNKTQCVCDAPLTESGKGYTLDLDFKTIRPYMYLDTYSISEWEDGWTVNGEILNPQN
ncbi:MAG: hypothetical protein J5769_02030 [Bacteroidales bacterium]|nr:hypothetical protein [Bacteroidales bacterium]